MKAITLTTTLLLLSFFNLQTSLAQQSSELKKQHDELKEVLPDLRKELNMLLVDVKIDNYILGDLKLLNTALENLEFQKSHISEILLRISTKMPVVLENQLDWISSVRHVAETHKPNFDSISDSAQAMDEFSKIVVFKQALPSDMSLSKSEGILVFLINDLLGRIGSQVHLITKTQNSFELGTYLNRKEGSNIEDKLQQAKVHYQELLVKSLHNRKMVHAFISKRKGIVDAIATHWKNRLYQVSNSVLAEEVFSELAANLQSDRIYLSIANKLRNRDEECKNMLYTLSSPYLARRASLEANAYLKELRQIVETGQLKTNRVQQGSSLEKLLNRPSHLSLLKLPKKSSTNLNDIRPVAQTPISIDKHTDRPILKPIIETPVVLPKIGNLLQPENFIPDELKAQIDALINKYEPIFERNYLQAKSAVARKAEYASRRNRIVTNIFDRYQDRIIESCRLLAQEIINEEDVEHFASDSMSERNYINFRTNCEVGQP